MNSVSQIEIERVSLHMFKIGEFSKITQVSIRMLRFYDENKLLIPEKIDADTGYRLYSGKQIEQLNRILFLKNLGFQVSKMQDVLKDWDTKRIQNELEMQKKQIEKNLIDEKERLLRLQMSLQDLSRQQMDLNTKVVIKSLESCYVLSLRKSVPDYFCEKDLWKELCEKIQPCSTSGSFSIYHDQEYKENEVDIEVCAIVEPMANQIANQIEDKEAGIQYRKVDRIEKAACFMVYGPYENIAVAYKEFAEWLEQHPEYEMCGDNRQICHAGEWNENNPELYVTELQVPIKIIL